MSAQDRPKPLLTGAHWRITGAREAHSVLEPDRSLTDRSGDIADVPDRSLTRRTGRTWPQPWLPHGKRAQEAAVALKLVSMEELKLELLSEPERTGDSIAEVCRRRGISRESFYLYRRRYEQEGAAGLESRSRRPLSSPGRIPVLLETEICALRQRRPRWVRLPRRSRPLPPCRARLPEPERRGGLGLLQPSGRLLRSAPAALVEQPCKLHRPPSRPHGPVRAPARQGGGAADQRRSRPPADVGQARAPASNAQGVAGRAGSARRPQAAAGPARSLQRALQHERPHQGIGDQTPAERYRASIDLGSSTSRS
jgi:transposase-like protein